MEQQVFDVRSAAVQVNPCQPQDAQPRDDAPGLESEISAGLPELSFREQEAQNHERRHEKPDRTFREEGKEYPYGQQNALAAEISFSGVHQMERMQGKDDEHRHQHVHPQEYTHSQKQRGSHQHESRRCAFHRVFETGPPVHHAGRYDGRNHRE